MGNLKDQTESIEKFGIDQIFFNAMHMPEKTLLNNLKKLCLLECNLQHCYCLFLCDFNTVL